MPTTRRRSARRSAALRIDRAVVAAWRAHDYAAVDRALGVKPWEPSINEVGTSKIVPSWVGECWTAAWPRIVELRIALEAAAREAEN